MNIPFLNQSYQELWIDIDWKGMAQVNGKLRIWSMIDNEERTKNDK